MYRLNTRTINGKKYILAEDVQGLLSTEMLKQPPGSPIRAALWSLVSRLSKLGVVAKPVPAPIPAAKAVPSKPSSWSGTFPTGGA